ncbi:unnamed protein product [Diabrotica balteata]|uniref:Uncharacterized protein n=1 Tax=Diabrotica balteata TaxID=107213 RepID=A0A9N9SRQ1_DIABA|nr:unnamed protein product [Diabrotica balteata]
MSSSNDIRSDLENLSTAMTDDQQSQNKTSYSAVFNNTSVQLNHAMLFNALPDTQIEKYLTALGEVVRARNILFSSRLSNSIFPANPWLKILCPIQQK